MAGRNTMQITLLVLIPILGFTQAPDTMWTKTYGGAESDRFDYIQETNDCDFISVGYTLSYGAGSYDAWIVRTDSLGDTLWTRVYGGPGSDHATSALQTLDSGFVVTGYTDHYGNGNIDAWLIRLSSFGDTLWTRRYGRSTLREDVSSIVQTHNGDYILVGVVYQSAADIDIWITRKDSGGNPLWNKTYGGNSYDTGSKIQQTNDGHYIIAGSTTNTQSDKNVWV